MDRFELNWPGVDAQLLTDGWRCRIVWRQRGRHHANGIGGTIDNNVQCVRRLAESLDGSPYLLGALRSRGHDRLARQIETVADAEPMAPAEPSTPMQAPAPTEAAPPARSQRREPAAAARKSVAPTTAWLDGLTGSDAWEAAANRRAKTWTEIGTIDGEGLFLKAPAPKGKPEWVIKRTWPDAPKRKAEYVVAGEFKGIACWLVKAGAGDAFIEGMLAAVPEVDHEALEVAARVWRTVQTQTTH